MSYRSAHEQSTNLLTKCILGREIEPIVHHVMGPSLLAHKRGRRDAVEAAVRFVLDCYGDSRRKVGAPAAVHPLRVARRVRLLGSNSVCGLIASLGHDITEDFDSLMPELPGLRDNERQRVGQLVASLTRGDAESYFAYVARLSPSNEALFIKLADRLDNTFDLRITADPGSEDPSAVYQVLFRKAVLDTLSPSGGREHPDSPPIHTADRLFDLFKTVVLLHFVRRRPELSARVAQAATKLATAACSEAELTALHLLEFHHSPGLAREAFSLLTTYGNRFWRITPSGGSPIDGLFQLFDARLAKRDRAVLAELQNDLPRLLMAALSMIVILTRFSCDEQFQGIKGLNEAGVKVISVAPPTTSRQL